ncbi:MAG: hypothetical protein RL715_817 [Chloroflexota bacterium]
MSIYLRGSTYWYAFMVKGKTYRGSCKTSNEREAQEYHDREKSKAWRRVADHQQLHLAHQQRHEAEEDDRVHHPRPELAGDHPRHPR